MRLRDWAILAIALFLLSTLVAVAVLVYVANRPAPVPVAEATPIDPGVNDQTTATTAGRPDGTPETGATTTILAPTQGATPLFVPPLITPTPMPSPAPTATPTPTWTPTLTPTPTWTPTPTPEPAVRLANAHRARQNGNYRRAIAEFQAMLGAPDTDGEAVEAAYQIGVCTYLDGDYATARERLDEFIRQYADDPRANAARFYLAQTFEGLGDYSAAIESYRAYLGHQDVLADQVYGRIGDGYALLGQYEAAIEAYTRALEDTVDLGQRYDLQEEIGLTYSAWGRYDDALAWLKGVAERSPNAYRLARLWYEIGQVYRLQGKETEARQAFSQAVNGDPRPGFAHAALVELVNADVPVNEYQRGLIDYYAGSYEAAIAAFDRFMQAAPDYNGEAHYYIAQSYLSLRSFDQAIQECDRMTARFASTTPRWGDMWLIKGEALYALKRVDEAREAYLGFADAYPTHSLAPQARWKAAWMLEREERFGEAADAYASLAARYPNDEQAPRARFQAGICRYRVGNVDAALLDWQALVDIYPGAAEAVQARYWLGKVLWAKGEVEQARGLLQKLAREHSRDFYGIRAAHLLENGGRPVSWAQQQDVLHLTSDEQAEKAPTAAWLRTWAGLPEGADPAKISINLSEDIRFRRGMELFSLGLYNEARDALDSLRQDVAQDPLLLYQLALLTRDLGLYSISIRATIDLIVLAPEASVLDMPRQIQRLAFPVYFSDLVLAESASQDLDPLLMFALIRQESVFDAQVRSWAGAIGLAQVIPDTGTWIAQMMPWPDYDEAQLQRAYVSVKFGAWFLNRILEQTDGDVIAALAGYNGGPANGVHWLDMSQGDPDLLVEIINYDEPQRYVREVYRHYDVYVKLYTNKQTREN